jgi:P4 family phage/plasmid primase-like protien
MTRRCSARRFRREAEIGNPIKIPQTLIDKLKQFGPCFVKIEKPVLGDSASGKKPFEQEWQKHPYQADDPELVSWLSHGGNYGAMAHFPILLIDADDKEVAEKLKDYPTFTGLSGGRGLPHLYYISDVHENGVIEDENGKHLGDIYAHDKQLVGPGSRHNTGGVYRISNDVPLVPISKEDLERIFGKRLKWTGQKRQEIEQEAEAERNQIGVEIPLRLLIDTTKFHQHGDELQGAHPLHGSLTGANLCVNLEKNLWHCFRHDTGGGGLMWLAVKHDLIKCEDAKPGALRGQNFIEAIKFAREEGFQVKLPDEELNPDVDRFFEEKKFVPALLGQELMKENRFLTEIGKKGKGLMFVYDKTSGIYQPDAEDYINSQTSKKLGKHYSINRERETEAFIKSRTLHDIPESSKDLIAVTNGVLDINTLELKDFSPDYYIFNALPVRYDPNAKCPVFDKFLSEVVSPEDARVLQEHGGDCLDKSSKFGKCVMLIGITKTGKSTFLFIIKAVLGEKNVSHITLQNLSDSSNRFAVARLYNKLANICADLPATALKETDMFKKIATHDGITGEFKFQTEFDFEPYTKLLFGANLTPPLPKDAEPFIERWNLINFPNQFLPDNPKTDMNLLEKMRKPEELSGILNWMISGHKRLKAQGKFSKVGTTEDTADRWSMAGDSQKAFLEREMIADLPSLEHLDMPVREEHAVVYAAYQKFCIIHKLQAVARRTFAENMPKYIECANFKTQIKKDAVWQDVYFWNGIRFKTNDEKA